MASVFRLLGKNFRPRHVIIVVVEWEFAAQERVKDHAQAPNIYFLSCILLALEHLRGRIADSAAKCLQVVGFALVLASKPKVYQLDILIFVQEDILELQIAVDAGLLVDVRNGPDELSERLLNLVNRQWSMF